MDPTIIAAIIGAGGAVIAAVVTYVLRRKIPKEGDASAETPPEGAKVVAKRIRADGDVIVSGRDTHVTQQSNDRFMSRQSARLVSTVADEMIRNREIRFRL